MDNLTHSLTGLMLARAGLHKLTPRASFLVILAANAPDIDIVSWLGGSARYIEVHRGCLHAWAALPLLALLPVALARWSLRWPKWTERIVGGSEPDRSWSWGKAWLASCIGIASHILFDWTNSYGIRFGLPFEASWHRLDLLFVIDPWVWAVLLMALFMPFLSRLISLEIGAKRSSGAGAAWFALIVLAAYIAGQSYLHQMALDLLGTRVFDGQNPRLVAAFPTFGNPLAWRALAELSDGYWVSQINLRDGFEPAEGRIFYQSEARAAVEAARKGPEFQAFLGFNRFPLWRVIPLPQPEGAVKVELYDLRFGDPTSPGFVATAIVENGRSGQEIFRLGAPRI